MRDKIERFAINGVVVLYCLVAIVAIANQSVELMLRLGLLK